jgi:hypothetical protein
MTSGRASSDDAAGAETIILIDRIGEALAQAEQRLLAGLDVDLTAVANLVGNLRAPVPRPKDGPSAGPGSADELERRLLVLISECDRMILTMRRDLESMTMARERTGERREGMLAYLKNAIR